MKTRNLTIMFTDIKGFTSKTSSSSREQLNKLLDLHENLIRPIFKDYGGKVIKTIGDAFLVVFHSPTDSVLCGMEIQKVLVEHNEKSTGDDQLEVRIAINSGEVTIKGNDVYGEAVNIAARLEGIAEAGDIYFTESVYLAMNKSEIPTAEIGYRHFKGIPHEIKVYKVISEEAARFNKSKIGTFFKPIGNYAKSFWKLIKKVAKWVLIIFIFLIIINILKNNGEKNTQEDKIAQLRQEVVGIVQDTKDAINVGDEQRAIKGIDTLKNISDQLGHPSDLEDIIRNLKDQYNNRFPKNKPLTGQITKNK